MKDLKKAFDAQRYTAKRRGIPFNFSFGEWMKVWLDSGHIEERGLVGDGYVMARFNDEGPYELGNIEIIRNSENTRQPQVREKVRMTMANRTEPPEGNYRHLRDRENHPKAKVVVGPDGTMYANATLAAEAEGIARRSMQQRCQEHTKGWRYKDNG